MDAIAVTVISQGRMIGLAPLGTSLTDEQATQLQALGVDPIIATDADRAGRRAAERDFWKLTRHGVQPRPATLPDGSDPAALLEAGNADQLVEAIDSARPLANVLIDQRLAERPAAEAALESLRIVAAQSPEAWESGHQHIADQVGLPPSLTRATLADLVRAWNRDPRTAAERFAAASPQTATGRAGVVLSATPVTHHPLEGQEPGPATTRRVTP